MGKDMWRLWFTKLLPMLLAAAVLFLAVVETRSEGEFSRSRFVVFSKFFGEPFRTSLRVFRNQELGGQSGTSD